MHPVVTDWTTGRVRVNPLQRQEIFPLTSVSKPALGPTQPPAQWDVDCRLLGVMGQDFISALQPVAYCTVPG
jgi:hypothetical protein